MNTRRCSYYYFFALFAVLILFTIYSYTQVDLNLTLSSNAIYQNIQRFLLNIGYFNRSLSASIFLITIIALYVLYFYGFLLLRKGRIKIKEVILIIGALGFIGILAYPAFSHDFFNYIFDARIVTKYGQNPYFYKALDFPDDLWIRFMRWTHRTYPYGPAWLIFTLPFSFFGFGKLVATIILFKIMFAGFYIGSCYLIYRILEIVSPKNKVAGLYIFAVNPLVIVETLISPHNEAMMLFFLLLAIYEAIRFRRILRSLIWLMISAATKFVSVILSPLIILIAGKKVSEFTRYYIIIFWALMSVFFIEIYYREAYSWYLIMPTGIMPLLINKKHYVYITVLLGFGGLLRYAPYLYTGEYTQSVQNAKDIIFIFPLLFFYALYPLVKRFFLLEKYVN